MKNYIYILLFLVSCSNKDVEMFPVPKENAVAIESREYLTEKILIDTAIQLSFEGEMGVYGDRLYFVDNILCNVFFFDTEGRFLQRSLGKGRGPTETILGGIDIHAVLKNGDWLFYGSTDDIYIHDSKFRSLKDKSYRINRKPYEINELIDYDQFELYLPGYPPVCRAYNNSIFTNNASERPLFNYFETPDIVVEEFRSITEQDLKNKKTGRLLGKGLPPIYKGSSSTHYMFSQPIFDIDTEGNFYVGYMADSLIYKYDKDYNPICSYGFEGIKMDKNYEKITTIEDLHEIGFPQLETKGYYNWVEYVDELGCLCRSYRKGDNEETDGLQIYRGTTLIADVHAPKGFKPKGYIDPYLYSEAIVEDEKMYVYRIKIN